MTRSRTILTYPKPETWYVYHGGPLDRAAAASLPVSMVLESPDPWWTDRPEPGWPVEQELPKAFAAVAQHPAWDGRLRNDPVLAYVPFAGAYCYIFNLQHAGTSFVVSPFRQPYLLTRRTWPGPYEELKVVVAVVK